MSEEEFKKMVFESYNKRFGDLGNMIAELEESKNKTNANRDEEFIWQLRSVVEEVETIAQVYLRDGGIHYGYALEKLQSAKSILDNSIEFFSKKSNKD